jgi:hypothetical protein
LALFGIHELNQRDSNMDVQRKLEILADAAKYDASCASSGTERRDSSDGKGMGSTAPGMGICHSYAPDGRCISLLGPPPTCRVPASPSTKWSS